MGYEKIFGDFPVKETSEIPKEVMNIKAVSRKENRYEQHAIEKAGYKRMSREGTKQAGYFTLWQSPLSPDILIFIEKPDGFLEYGGIMVKEEF